MKLIVYFSRTGTTKAAAGYLHQLTGGDCEELIDRRSYKGIFGAIIAAKMALAKQPSSIEKTTHNPKNYDEVIIMTPIWGGAVCPAVRTYLSNHLRDLKNVSLVTLAASSDAQRVANDLREHFGLDFGRVVSVKKADVKSGLFKKQLIGIFGQ